MRIPALGRRSGRLAKLALFPAVALLVAACTDQARLDHQTGDEAVPGLFTGEVVTVEGAQAASLYLPIFIVATIIFILVEGLLLYMSLRFRRRSTGDDLPEQTHGHNKLEILWTVIPAIVVTVMFIGSTLVLADVQAESDDPAVVVDVEAFRFGWKFDYGDYGITIVGGGHENPPAITVPIDVPIRFRVTAVDVIHSFYVPSFFYKIDAIPGRVNQFEVTIEKVGVYGGQCAEFCGLAHGDMFFNVDAVEQSDFDAWVEEQTGGVTATIAERAS